jgi:hypothetical protein
LDINYVYLEHIIYPKEICVYLVHQGITRLKFEKQPVNLENLEQKQIKEVVQDLTDVNLVLVELIMIKMEQHLVQSAQIIILVKEEHINVIHEAMV